MSATEPAAPPQTRSPVIVQAPAQAAAIYAPADSLLGALYELTKPRITRMVAMTAGVGYVLALSAAQHAGIPRSFTRSDLALSALACLLGTAISASGANALNMWWERSRDARMKRTCTRPIPAGALTSQTAFTLGLACSLIGIVTLLYFNGPAAATVSLSTILIYVLIYTPSKPLTPLNTLIGAVPGALPPLIGWCAGSTLVTGLSIDWAFPLTQLGGWSLFALMFIWQLPHFLAIAWMYREDYAAGGFRMLPAIDPTGTLTARCTLIGAILLLPATLWPAFAIPNALGWVYQSIALLTGLTYILLAARLNTGAGLTRPRSRVVFFASIIHLPILLIAMVAEVLIRALW